METKAKTQKHGGARVGAGRKAFRPTKKQKEQVVMLAGWGNRLTDIAALVGVGVDTLRKYFEKEILEGKAKANSAIGQRLYLKAMDGDTTAMLWWTKTQMGWVETQKLQHSGNVDTTVKVIERRIVNAKN